MLLNAINQVKSFGVSRRDSKKLFHADKDSAYAERIVRENKDAPAGVDFWIVESFVYPQPDEGIDAFSEAKHFTSLVEALTYFDSIIAPAHPESLSYYKLFYHISKITNEAF